jgi:hypothetical protein
VDLQVHMSGSFLLLILFLLGGFLILNIHLFKSSNLSAVSSLSWLCFKLDDD